MFQKRKKFFWFILTAICCSHLFFVNIKSSHDWGDDFAQYIHQAKNITEGISQSQTGYLYNPQFAVLGPPAYPVGFPLLLAPVYAAAGNNIKAFNYEMSFFLFVMMMLSFIFFRKTFSAFAAWILVLIMAFNPWLINFKTEINSDIPFACFVLLTILYYMQCRRTVLNAVVIALLCGFAFSVRTVGATLIAAVFIDQLYRWPKRDAVFSKTFLAIIPLGAMGFYFLLNKILFPLPEGFFGSAAANFTFQKIYETILFNLNYYFEVLQSLFFTDSQNRYRFISTFMMSCLLCFTVTGFAARLKKKITIAEVFFAVYMLTLLIYPYAHSGFRFLIPVLPFVLLYAAESVRLITTALELGGKRTFILTTAALFFMFYKFDLLKIWETRKKITEGPQQYSSKETFDYIIKNTTAADRILFIKPRALALYTGRECFSAHPKATASEIKSQTMEYGIDYILISHKISDDGIRKFILENDSVIKQVWTNADFSLYKNGN